MLLQRKVMEEYFMLKMPGISISKIQLLLIIDLSKMDHLCIQSLMIYSCFQKCYNCDKGGAFALNNSDLYDQGSVFSQLSSFDGGSIYCGNCSISLQSSYFENNYGYNGGQIVVYEQIRLFDSQNVTFKNSKSSLRGGVFYFCSDIPKQVQTNLRLENITIFDAFANQGGVFSIKFMSLNLIISNIQIEKAGAQNGGVFYISEIQSLNITKPAKFTKLYAYIDYTFLATFAKDSFFYFSDVEIVSNNDNLLNVIESSYIQSSILAKQSFQGTSIQFYGSSQIIFERVNIMNSYLGSLGGTFSIQDVKNFSDTNSTYKNTAGIQGGFMYSLNSPIFMRNIQIQNALAYYGGIFYLYGSIPAYLDNCTFYNSKSLADGGLLYLSADNVWYYPEFLIIIQSSIFKNIQSKQSGGAFYLDNAFLELLEIENSQFSNIEADTDGGIILVNQTGKDIIIKNNCSFTDFKAGDGGDGSFIYSTSNKLVLSITHSIIKSMETFNYTQAEQFIHQGENKGGSVIYIKDAVKLNMTEVTIKNAIGAKYGGVFQQINTLFYLSKLTISEIFAINGGILYQLNSTAYIEYSNFSSIESQFGGIFFTNDNSYIQTQNSMFFNVVSRVRGGIISVQEESNQNKNPSNYIFQGCKFMNIISQSGGFAYVDNIKASLSIITSDFKNIRGYLNGGLILSQNIKSLTIIESKFEDIFSNHTSILDSTSQDFQLIIKNSKFICDNEFDTTLVPNQLNSSSPIYNYEYTIKISKAKYVNLTQNTFKLCGVTSEGGVFAISYTTLIDDGSTYDSNYGIHGGVIQGSQVQIDIRNSKFINNKAKRGGVFSLNSASQINLTGSIFQQNQGFYESGVLNLETSSVANVFNCKFLQNMASESSVMLVMEGSKDQNITFRQCLFEANKAQKNTISVLQANLLIEDSQFLQNTATERSKNIFAGFSSLYIFDTLFRGITYKNTEKQLQIDQTFGCFIFIILDVKLYIKNGYFINGLAKQGGAIFITGDSKIDIIESQFNENYAYLDGGAIYSSGFQYLNILENSKFSNNRANEMGDDIHGANTLGQLHLENTNFNNPGASLSIYAANLGLYMNEVTMNNIGNDNEDHQYGSALYCLDCKTIHISDSEFTNMKSYLGGAFYIEELTQNKINSLQSAKYEIRNSNFVDCQSVSGGALYLLNIEKMIISNSKFISNEVINSTASNYYKYHGSGGAIYYECTDQNYNCELTIKNNSQFNNNFATRQGGAIHWESLEPIISADVQFLNNIATQYGNDLSCFAQRIIKINQETYLNTMKNLGIEQRRQRLLTDYIYPSRILNVSISTQIKSQRSGGTMPGIYVALVDKYGQIIGIDQESKVRVNIDSFIEVSKEAQAYPPIIEGQSQFAVLGGVVYIQNIQFTGTPGYQYSLTLTTDGIDLKKKSNKEYLSKSQNNSSSDIDFKVQVQLRECEIGEQFTVVGKCEECEYGNSFSLVKMNEPGLCKICPTDKARCYGGTNIGPKPGYWRKNNATSFFIQCQYMPACLGMIPPANDPKGSCLNGYQGILCADCLKGYSRQGDFKCQECPKTSVNSIRLVAIFIALTLMIIFVVRSTLLGAKEKKNVTSIFLKIMMNHLQLIILCSAFNFDWPRLLIDFFTEIKPVAQVSTQILSFDCFIDKRQSDDDNDQLEIFRIFYQKLVMLALLPILLAFCSWLFWVIYHKIKYQKEEYVSKIITTLIILLFLVHPNIVHYMFNNFKCINIDGDNMLLYDLEINCWGDVHSLFSYFIALPSIFVWGLGIPFFALILLMKVRKNLDSIETRQKLGFLYRGYRKKYHYWEIIIMYRKILLIFISVFVSTFGVMAQALIVFIVLILFLILNLKAKPFSTVALNDLETVSLVTSMITIYCGLFFLSNTKQSQIDQDPELKDKAVQLSDNVLFGLFIIIVSSNCIFFFYWLYKMLFEVKGKIMRSTPKLYLFFCSCSNQQQFQKDLKQLKLDEENDALREEFLKSKYFIVYILYIAIRNIKLMQQDGRIMLNQKNLEKLQIYLDSQNIMKVIKSDNNKIVIDEKQGRRNSRKQNLKDALKLTTKKESNNQLGDSYTNTFDKEDSTYKDKSQSSFLEIQNMLTNEQEENKINTNIYNTSASQDSFKFFNSLKRDRALTHDILVKNGNRSLRLSPLVISKDQYVDDLVKVIREGPHKQLKQIIPQTFDQQEDQSITISDSERITDNNNSPQFRFDFRNHLYNKVQVDQEDEILDDQYNQERDIIIYNDRIREIINAQKNAEREIQQNKDFQSAIQIQKKKKRNKSLKYNEGQKIQRIKTVVIKKQVRSPRKNNLVQYQIDQEEKSLTIQDITSLSPKGANQNEEVFKFREIPKAKFEQAKFDQIISNVKIDSLSLPSDQDNDKTYFNDKNIDHKMHLDFKDQVDLDSKYFESLDLENIQQFINEEFQVQDLNQRDSIDVNDYDQN
ncbi:UNKNOWN [Stylonychia lemnae]|uniref:Transmembrane protein n=1 Tax=Stylonychia lemnae TaxID=5949 RepID=A0A077ZQD2_STYLE|nr:UNKNOWN [Stylonychia lemnae]|eukprot:CDW72107.1 UNKNOWN [Stylonychia lemnae]